MNPLDCNNQSMQCGNPCQCSPANTAQCESLPSQIQNFTDQFFGVVVKTELNGEVTWSLPCGLDTGLPANPRAEGEGLACYFLRLFRDGIAGLQGPPGDPGVNGADGANTYTVTIQNFLQPTLNNPLTQIVVVPNPSIVEGMGLFIQHSGSYQVSDVAPGGVVFLTLVSPLSTALSVIPAGSLVVPVGVPGAGLGPQGPPGVTGPQGPQGIPGVPGFTITSENGTYSAIMAGGGLVAGAVDFPVPAAWTTVTFTTTQPEFTPATAAKYSVQGSISVTGLGGAVVTDQISIRLVTSDGIVFFQSFQVRNYVSAGQQTILPLTAIVQTTGAVGQKVQVQAFSSNASGFSISPQGTVLTWVRIS